MSRPLSALPPEELPRVHDDLTIVPQGLDGAGRPLYVASVGSRAFLVSATVAALVTTLQAHPNDAEAVRRAIEDAGVDVQPGDVGAFVARVLPPGMRAGSETGPPPPPFLVRRRLLSPRVAHRVGNVGAWLFRPALAGVVVPVSALLAGAAFHTAAAAPLRAAPASPLVVAGSIVGAMLVHEIGHVSAMAYYGLAPGEVGAALYFWFPVLYTDVSRSWRLPREARLVVTAAGFYFQLLVAGLVGAWGVLARQPQALWFVFVNVLAILHMLNPVFKMDGYWLLSDAARVPNLHRRVSAAVRAAGARALGRPSPDATYRLTPVQHALLWVYALVAGVYLGVIGTRLWHASVAALASRPAYTYEVSALVARVHSARTAGVLLNGLTELVYAGLRPVLLAAAWAFLGVMVLRLAAADRPRRVAT